ncbi:MAG TPA: STAS domain-containing protein [Acidimicrobiales bacterium]|jgi:anti-sigma B factor antagonist
MPEVKTSESTDPESGFQVAIWQRGRESVTIVLSGELDLASAPRFRSALADLAVAGILDVVVDVANLQFIDSTGIGILVTDFKRLTHDGGSIAIRNAGPRIYRLFEMTGLIEPLSVTPLAIETPVIQSVEGRGKARPQVRLSAID